MPRKLLLKRPTKKGRRRQRGVRQRAPLIDMPFDEFKKMFDVHLDRIRRSPNGDRTYKYFRSEDGKIDNLHDLNIVSGTGASYSGYIIANFHADNGKIYPVYCKVFSMDLLDGYVGGLLTEACISANNVNQKPLIINLVRNYGVLMGNYEPSEDFFSRLETINFAPHTANENINRPVYIFNEMFILVNRVQDLSARGTAMSLYKFVEETKGDFLLGNHIFKLIYQGLLTIKQMHERGLYHNDLHAENIMVVKENTEEYGLRIFDWDYGFSNFPCMPPPKYMKNWCGDMGGCYRERDYWDVLRFITSLGLTINELETIFPGNPILMNGLKNLASTATLQNWDLDEYYNEMSEMKTKPDSVQELIDGFNPVYKPNLDTGSSRKQVTITFDKVYSIITRPYGGETFDLTPDARKMMANMFEYLFYNTPSDPFSEDDVNMVKFREYKAENPELSQDEAYVVFVMDRIYTAVNEQTMEEGGSKFTSKGIVRALRSNILSYMDISPKFFETALGGGDYSRFN